MIVLRRLLMRLLCRYAGVTCLCLLAISLYVFISISYLGEFRGEAVVFKERLVEQPVVFKESNYVTRAVTKTDTITDQEHLPSSGPSNVPTDELPKHVDTMQNTYIQEENMDLPEGDMPCEENEECRNIQVRSPEQAKAICDLYGSRCKGFVYSEQSGKFLPKSELMHKMVSTLGQSLYIKKAFAESNLNTSLDGACAVPLDQTQSLTDTCCLPDLDPYDESITKHIKTPEKPLQCPGSQITRYQGGVLELVEDDGTEVVNVTHLMYQPILRPAHNDWGFELGNEVILNAHDRRFELGAEFIRVQLTTAKGAKHVEYHAQTMPRSPPPVYGKTGLPLSVVIIGFDSLSAAHFKRALPEAYEFMTETLDSVFLDGYSVVGDGTTPALTALMTGKFESELPEARREFAGTASLDRWPHIFKDFSARDYATLFSEDCPVYAAFNYRLHGFTEPPTNHFGRFFWEAAKLSSAYCVQSQPQHKIHFDYIKSFSEAYQGQPKFGLFFLTDISHNNLGSIYNCADDFLSLLKTMSDRNLLNDTLLIVMSDHGFRYGDARTTLQGKLEERLPLMSLTFPKWFREQNPEMVQNLKQNSDIVTSPFDLYATFRHILTYPQTPRNLMWGESLFTKINQSRDCAETGVAEHYCPCVQWKAIDISHNHVMGAARAVVKHVNNLTASDPLSLSLCSKLELHKVLKAYQEMPNLKVRQFLGSADVHGRKPMFSRDTATVEGCVYQVQIQTMPGGGLYEASVIHHKGKWRVTGEISRINLYGEQPRCILHKRPDLRKYCLCKDYVDTSREN